MSKFKHADIYQNARFAGQVSRYHTWPVQRDQSTGEHTWQVLRIYCQIFGAPSPAATMYMVWHDGGELVSGDAPGMLKTEAPEIKPILDRVERKGALGMGAPDNYDTIDARTRTRVKVCDLLDAWEFGLVEVLQGNRFAEPIIAWAAENITRQSLHLADADAVLVGEYLERTREKFQQ